MIELIILALLAILCAGVAKIFFVLKRINDSIAETALTMLQIYVALTELEKK